VYILLTFVTTFQQNEKKFSSAINVPKFQL